MRKSKDNMSNRRDKSEIAKEILELIKEYDVIESFGGVTGQSYTCLQRIAADPTVEFDKSIRYDCFYNLNSEHRPLGIKIEELELASSSFKIAHFFKFWKWLFKAK